MRKTNQLTGKLMVFFCPIATLFIRPSSRLKSIKELEKKYFIVYFGTINHLFNQTNEKHQ